jgi:hypothetical protein
MHLARTPRRTMMTSMDQPQTFITERRGTARREVNWHVRIVRSSGEAFDAVCTDIGDGGLGFQTRIVLAVGEMIDLEFAGAATDGKAPHPAVRVQIIYRSRDQYGATFVPGAQ